MVESSQSALPLAKTPESEEQMACPECIAKRALVEASSQSAIDFRAINLAIQDIAKEFGLAE